jgi:hypothetical protein
MKSLYFVYSFAVLMLAAIVIMLLVGQLNPVVHADQLNALPAAQASPAGAAAQPGAATQKGVSFAKAVNYNSGGGGADSVAVADVNGDGIPDLIVVNWDQSDGGEVGGVGVLLGNGDGTFQPSVTYTSGGFSPYSVAVADVNHDGKADIVVANFFVNDYSNVGALSVLLGSGDGTFQAPVSYSSGGYGATSVAIGDVNGDGNPDLVVANSDSSVSVLLGNGDGTFQAPVSYSSDGYGATSVAIGDVNGDGNPDLVVAKTCQSEECDNGAVSVLLGNGDGTFQSAGAYSTGGFRANSVAIGDVNSDGKPDLAVVSQCATDTNCNFGVVGVLLGNGDGTFQPVVTYGSRGYDAESVVIGDVNGDGNADLVAVNYCNKLNRNGSCAAGGVVSVLIGNGDGTFRAAVAYNSGGHWSKSVALMDVNGDGKPDLLVATSCSKLYGYACDGNGLAGVLLNDFTATTKTKVSSSPNPSIVNQAVTLTATITSSSSVPNGSVITFYDGASEIGTGRTANGVATLTTSFSTAGKYTIKATYPGDVFHGASTGTVKQVINP